MIDNVDINDDNNMRWDDNNMIWHDNNMILDETIAIYSTRLNWWEYYILIYLHETIHWYIILFIDILLL